MTFKPDPQIFQQTREYKLRYLGHRMRELSYLNKGITIVMEDRRQKDEKGDFSPRPSIREEGLERVHHIFR